MDDFSQMHTLMKEYGRSTRQVFIYFMFLREQCETSRAVKTLNKRCDQFHYKLLMLWVYARAHYLDAFKVDGKKSFIVFANKNFIDICNFMSRVIDNVKYS